MTFNTIYRSSSLKDSLCWQLLFSKLIQYSDNMPTYKLYYFDSRGRAEGARWIFKLTGTKFEDIRYTKEEWLTKKEGNNCCSILSCTIV